MGKTVAIIGLMGLMGLAVMGCAEYWNNPTPGPTRFRYPTRAPTPTIDKDAACLRDAKCASERRDWLSSAVGPCGRLIENQAAFDYDWTTGPGGRFDGVQVQTSGQQIRYYGSNLRFQNGFGAWQRMNYTCLFDPIEDQVLYVEVEPW